MIMRKTLVLNSLLVIVLSSWGGLTAQEDNEVPENPTHLRAFTRFDGSMGVTELSWHDESENELGFEILRGDNGTDFQLMGMVGANTTGYEDKVGKYVTGTFVYKIRAFNSAGRSEDSNLVSVWF